METMTNPEFQRFVLATRSRSYRRALDHRDNSIGWFCLLVLLVSITCYWLIIADNILFPIICLIVTSALLGVYFVSLICCLESCFIKKARLLEIRDSTI